MVQTINLAIHIPCEIITELHHDKTLSFDMYNLSMLKLVSRHNMRSSLRLDFDIYIITDKQNDQTVHICILIRFWHLTLVSRFNCSQTVYYLQFLLLFVFLSLVYRPRCHNRREGNDQE